MKDNKEVRKGAKTSQHYVPKVSLKRFTDSKGMLKVYKKDLSKTYLQDPKHVACEDLMYDIDPEERYSVENYLKSIEDECQGCIDRIIEGKSPLEDQVIAVRYVSMIIGRSVKLKQIESENPTPPEAKPYGYDIRNTYIEGITESKRMLMGIPVEDYCGIIMHAVEPYFFITADVPYTLINLSTDGPLLKKEDVEWALSSTPLDQFMDSKTWRMKKELARCMNDALIACPLTPDRCLIIWPKGANPPGPRLMQVSNGDPVSFINSMIAANCYKEVYSHPDDDFAPQLKAVISRINEQQQR